MDRDSVQIKDPLDSAWMVAEQVLQGQSAE